jgi:S1-C subfamily serine protease
MKERGFMGLRGLSAIIAMVCLAVGLPAGAAENRASGSRPATLSRVVFALKEGEVWALWGNRLYCDLSPREVRWKAENPELDAHRLATVFNEELVSAGLKSDREENLFEPESASGTLKVGAIIKDMHARICSAPRQGMPSRRTFRGSVDMTVEWQVFDPLRRETLARLTTSAKGEQRDRSFDGVERIIVDGFRENARALIAMPQFVEVANAAASRSDAPPKPADRTTLLIALAKEGKLPIADAVGSVVTIFSADGHGSGFLISADGYLLTARHVVGESKTVRVRWSDGFEADGEVLRQDKRRDVALIKAPTAHSRRPLVLRSTLLNAGDPVYAIGTPLDPKLANTVTKGVASAYRTRIGDGLSFLQSDVSVNHGNSGGPLLDERGAVVGFTDWGIMPDGPDTPVGLNFFVPIGDALDFLAIRPAP